MYLVVADTVQGNGFLSTLALGNEMMLVSLILRDDTLAHRADYRLRRRIVP